MKTLWSTCHDQASDLYSDKGVVLVLIWNRTTSLQFEYSFSYLSTFFSHTRNPTHENVLYDKKTNMYKTHTGLQWDTCTYKLLETVFVVHSNICLYWCTFCVFYFFTNIFVFYPHTSNCLVGRMSVTFWIGCLGEWWCADFWTSRDSHGMCIIKVVFIYFNMCVLL